MVDTVAEALVYEFRADVSGLQAGARRVDAALAQAERGARRTGDEIGRSFDKAGREIERTGNLLTTFGRGFGAALAAISIEQLVSGARNAIKSLDDLGDSAERLGIGVENLQELRYALQTNGAAAEDADRGLAIFERRLSEASRKSNDLSRFLEANGVKLKDAEGKLRPVNDLLRDFATLIQRADPGQQLDFARLGLLGSAEEWVSILRQGPGAFDKAAAAARQVGVHTAEEVKRAGELNDKWEALAWAIENRVKGAILNVADATDSWLNNLETKGIGVIARLFEGIYSAERINAPFRQLPGGPAATAGPGESATDALKRAMGVGTPTVAPPPAGGGGSAKTAAASANEYERAVEAIEKRTEALRIEAATVGMATEAAAKFRATEELLNAAKAAGIPITADLRREIDAQAASNAAAADSAAKLKAAQQAANDAQKAFAAEASGAIESLIVDGEKLNDVIADVLRNIARMLIQGGIAGTGPLAGILGTASTTGGAGGLAGLFAGMFAGGGHIPAGKWGVVGENGPEPAFGGRSGLSVFPNESMRGGGNFNYAPVYNIGANADPRQIERLEIAMADDRAKFGQNVMAVMRGTRSRMVR